MGLLDRAGAEMTSDVEAAEILVVNTCSFIDAAKQESVDTILEMAQHKVDGSWRQGAQADRGRVSGGAVPGRDSEEYSGSGCGGGHG